MDEVNPTTPHSIAASWWRLHRSTKLLVGLIACLWLLIAVPGERQDGEYSTTELYEHGWPWVFQSREVSKPGTLNPFGASILVDQITTNRSAKFSTKLNPSTNGLNRIPFYTSPDNWMIWHGEAEWYLSGLIANLLVAGLMMAVTVLGIECRRRKRKHWYHLNLRDLLLAGLVASVACGWYTSYRGTFDREQSCLNSVEEYRAELFVEQGIEVTPTWLRRLTDNRLLRGKINDFQTDSAGWRVTEVKLQSNFLSKIRDPESFAKQLDQLTYVKSLSIWLADQSCFDVMKTMETQRITHLQLLPRFGEHSLSITAVERFENLEFLLLRSINFREVEFSFPILPRLEYVQMDQDKINERCITWFKQLQALQRLALWESHGIDRELVKRLSKELPGVRIEDQFGKPIAGPDRPRRSNEPH